MLVWSSRALGTQDVVPLSPLGYNLISGLQDEGREGFAKVDTSTMKEDMAYCTCRAGASYKYVGGLLEMLYLYITIATGYLRLTP